MESKSSGSSTSSGPSNSKRLLFDRRYGWVVDEWKDPSEEALAGGRGMFCVVPLARALLHSASETINVATNLTVKALENPDILSPQLLQADLCDRLNKLVSSIQTQQLQFGFPKGDSSSCTPTPSSSSNHR